MRGIRIAQVSEAPLDLAAHVAAVQDPHGGAVVTFVGTVRDHDPDATAPVVLLEYSAHPDAERVLREIAEAALGDREALVAVSHRVGRLEVGGAAVVIAVAAAHRADAFDVCRDVIEAIKRDLPVWKRQHTVDGDAQWKGLGG